MMRIHRVAAILAVIALVASVAAKAGRVERFSTASARFATTASPWGVTFSKDGKYLFVGGEQLVAYRFDPEKLVVTVVRTVNFSSKERVHGLAVSPDGALLVAGGSTRIRFFSIANLVGGQRAMLASVPIPTSGITSKRAPGAQEPVFSPDGTRVACPIEYQRRVAIFDTQLALQNVGEKAIVGFVEAGSAPVGASFFPDSVNGGRDLVAFTNQSDATVPKVGECSGSVRVANFRTAKLVKTIPAGCSPVRIAVGDKYMFVTSRGDDKVIGIDRNDERKGIVVPVGPNPVGIRLASNGRHMVVAASNRFDAADGEINVIDTQTLAVKRIPGLKFPRGVAVDPSGNFAAVTYYKSAVVELVNVTRTAAI